MQKTKLQAFLVPTGLTWDGKRVGTVTSGLFFSRLTGELSGEGSLVALRGSSTFPRLEGTCKTARRYRFSQTRPRSA